MPETKSSVTEDVKSKEINALETRLERYIDQRFIQLEKHIDERFDRLEEKLMTTIQR